MLCVTGSFPRYMLVIKSAAPCRSVWINSTGSGWNHLKATLPGCPGLLADAASSMLLQLLCVYGISVHNRCHWTAIPGEWKQSRGTCPRQKGRCCLCVFQVPVCHAALKTSLLSLMLDLGTAAFLLCVLLTLGFLAYDLSCQQGAVMLQSGDFGYEKGRDSKLAVRLLVYLHLFPVGLFCCQFTIFRTVSISICLSVFLV